MKLFLLSLHLHIMMWLKQLQIVPRLKMVFLKLTNTLALNIYKLEESSGYTKVHACSPLRTYNFSMHSHFKSCLRRQNLRANTKHLCTSNAWKLLIMHKWSNFGNNGRWNNRNYGILCFIKPTPFLSRMVLFLCLSHLDSNLKFSIKQRRQFRTLLWAMSLTMPRLLLLTTYLEKRAVFNKEAATSAKSKYARRCPRMCIWYSCCRRQFLHL